MFHKLSLKFIKTGSLKHFQTENTSHTAAGKSLRYLTQDTNTSKSAHLMRQTRACSTEMKRTKIYSEDEECNKERHYFPTVSNITETH